MILCSTSKSVTNKCTLPCEIAAEVYAATRDIAMGASRILYCPHSAATRVGQAIFSDRVLDGVRAIRSLKSC